MNPAFLVLKFLRAILLFLTVTSFTVSGFRLIDPEPQNNPSEINDNGDVALCIARAKNFECIVRNLKSLFEDEFGQTILVLPDCYILGYHPETKQGLEQMKILLTLLLGAAVQCPNKELFIARIKELDVETQHAIVELIKQVTFN